MTIPFSNSSEYATWLDKNCDRCVKHLFAHHICPIEDAIDGAMFGEDFTDEMCNRMGQNSGKCTELVYPWYVTGKDGNGKCLLFGPFNTQEAAQQKYDNVDNVITWFMVRGQNLDLKEMTLQVEQMPSGLKGQVTLIEEDIKKYESNADLPQL